MDADKELITRRSFLKAAAPCLVLGLGKLNPPQTAAESNPLTERNLAECRTQLLELINVERGLAGVPPVALDELACTVESDHARDMAMGRFLSHWGSDDRKPYQRYSFAGGTDYTEENVSASDRTPPLRPPQVAAELIGINLTMHAEKPPNDGHRRVILGPDHTHVGFGIALNGTSLRLAEMFIARYSDIEPVLRDARPKAKFVIKGRLLNRSHIFHQADVFYEPLPLPALAQSKKGQRYGLPDEFVTLLPTLEGNMTYLDGKSGSIELGSHGQFRMPVKLKDKPGIYTIVIWIRKSLKQSPFPVTEICIKAE